MAMVFNRWSTLTLTENHIKQLHRDLLQYSTKDERHRREYKRVDNSVAAFHEAGKNIGIIFETISPLEQDSQPDSGTPRRISLAYILLTVS